MKVKELKEQLNNFKEHKKIIEKLKTIISGEEWFIDKVKTINTLQFLNEDNFKYVLNEATKEYEQTIEPRVRKTKLNITKISKHKPKMIFDEQVGVLNTEKTDSVFVNWLKENYVSKDKIKELKQKLLEEGNNLTEEQRQKETEFRQGKLKAYEDLLKESDIE